MNSIKLLINLLLISGLAFTTLTACDKADDPSDDFLSTEIMKDADGNIYKTVKIGSQVWMAVNLKTTKYNDGSPIPNVTDNDTWTNLKTGAYCNYDNLESNVTTYGRLYNWYTVNTGKLAPTGWHVATDDEWTTLENYLSANIDSSGSAAKALASKTDWALSTEAGAVGNDLTKNNTTGFTALPGGGRYNNGPYFNIKYFGHWWSSSESSEGYAYFRIMLCGGNHLTRISSDEQFGFSVRCVRD